jgi:single-stranded-DNA-specific exonuclease
MVALKFIQAMIPDLEDNKELYEELISITTIGTISDVMELLDENRYLVKKGLKYLSKSRNIGIRILCNNLNLHNKELCADDIGFLIAPCLNAAGRLDTPDIAEELLLCDDNAEADKLSKKIIALNDKRKRMQKEVIESIEVKEDEDFIIVNSDGIGHGILGIVAGTITEKYQRPCFVLCGNQEKNKLSGSGRSIYGYDINSCVQANKDIASGGGHAAACGVSLKFEDLEEFKKRCNEHFRKYLENASIDDMTPQLNIACEIDLDIISERLVNNISKLEPYGNGNEEPIFCTKNVKVDSFKVVGKNANVIQMGLSKDDILIKAVGFNNIKNKFEELNNLEKIDIIYKIGLNEWPEGTFNLQLRIEDLKVSI